MNATGLIKKKIHCFLFLCFAGNSVPNYKGIKRSVGNRNCKINTFFLKKEEQLSTTVYFQIPWQKHTNGQGISKTILLMLLSDTLLYKHTLLQSVSDTCGHTTPFFISDMVMYKDKHFEEIWQNNLIKQQHKCHKWFRWGQYNIKQHACTLVASLLLWIKAITEAHFHAYTYFLWVFLSHW